MRAAALRLGTVLVAILVGMAAMTAPAASADQAVQVSATPTAPIDGATTTITVTGSSDTGGSVYVSLDGGGATCGSNPSNDGGNLVISGDSVAGPTYSDSTTITAVDGTYTVCAWLQPAGDDGSGVPLAGPASTPLTVQALSATVTLSAPVHVDDQQPVPVTVSWQAHSAGSLFVDILPSSYGACTASPANEPQYLGWLSGQNGYTNNDPIGQGAVGGTNRYLAGEFAPGSYQVCAWVEEPSGNVVAGPVSVSVQMLALPGSRSYAGRTSQHLPIEASITGDTVRNIIYSARFRCSVPEYFGTGLRWNGVWNGTVLTASNFGDLKVVAGRFTARLDANPANRVDIGGTVSGNTLTGWLNAVMRVGRPQFRSPAICRTGTVRFTIGIQSRHRRSRR